VVPGGDQVNVQGDPADRIVVDVEDARKIVVLEASDRVSILFGAPGQEYGLYMSGRLMDRLVELWRLPRTTADGMPIAHEWRKP
jgi:hypothetical protein